MSVAKSIGYIIGMIRVADNLVKMSCPKRRMGQVEMTENEFRKRC